MRGLVRLNGWQRIGIVLSVLWAIGAGVHLWLGWQTVSYGYWRAYYPSVLEILALSGWRWRKVSYAVGHERFGVASMPKRSVGA